VPRRDPPDSAHLRGLGRTRLLKISWRNCQI